MINEIASLISTLGFPVAVVCYLLWERHKTMCHFEKVIKEDLVDAICDLKLEIVKLNERVDGPHKD